LESLLRFNKRRAAMRTLWFRASIVSAYRRFMKTIGMIGGMSWESTSVYYQLINRTVQDRVGGVHSAKAVMHSFDFGEIAPMQASGRWVEANAKMAGVAVALEQAGADFLIMCCNTMHTATAAIEQEVNVPFLHIADPLGAELKTRGITRVGLLGTTFTMGREDIIRGRLTRDYGVEVLTPSGADAIEVNRIIYEELIRGRFLDSARAHYRESIARLVDDGAEGIVLGCTELPLVVKDEDSAVPLFDTTTLHALAAVDFALA
jgi:aspartate racemase